MLYKVIEEVDGEDEIVEEGLSLPYAEYILTKCLNNGGECYIMEDN